MYCRRMSITQNFLDSHFKRSKSLLNKPLNKLTDEDKSKLSLMLWIAPRLAIAYRLKNYFMLVMRADPDDAPGCFLTGFSWQNITKSANLTLASKPIITGLLRFSILSASLGPTVSLKVATTRLRF